MRRFIPCQPVLRRGLAAICLIAIPWIALAQKSRPVVAGDDDDDEDTPSVYVSVEAGARGDVQFSIYASAIEKTQDFTPILKATVPCDWRSTSRSRWFAEGTCRHLLRVQETVVNDTLNLAPLVAALHVRPGVTVRVTLNAEGAPATSQLPSWERSDVRHAASYWTFLSADPHQTPPPFAVRSGTAWRFSRLAIPLSFVLFGPPILALWIRRRMNRLGQTADSGIIWLNWLILGAWLYWISAVNIADLTGFIATLDLEQWPFTLLAASLLFFTPPLVMIAGCMVVLSPRHEVPDPAASEDTKPLFRTVLLGVARNAIFIIPLGLLLTGIAMLQEGASGNGGLVGILLAYGAFRLLLWGNWRMTSGTLTTLDMGELRARASQIAQTAGVTLRRLSLIGNGSPVEANAFAMAGGAISLTRGLVQNLTRREVDAVIGHEVGHLRANHGSLTQVLYIAYFFFLAPIIKGQMEKIGMPHWLLALPFEAVLYVLVTSWFSQRHEFDADVRSIQLTRDPEAMMAALARLARLTQTPINWGGIQGSILSHPSMRRRVLSIARHSGIPDQRALAILHDPDLLESDVARSHYALPDRQAEAARVYTPAARLTHGFWTAWACGGTLMGLLIALKYGILHLPVTWLVRHAHISFKLMFLIRSFAFLALLPLVFWLSMTADEWRDRRFLRRMRRKIEARKSPAPGSIFVGLLPGDRIVPFEWVHAWDLGFLRLDAERLSYDGDGTQFSVARDEVESIEVARGKLAWVRTYGVVIRTASAAFSFRLADRGRRKRFAMELQKRLQAWQSAVPSDAPAPSTEIWPRPLLPALSHTPLSRLRTFWLILKPSCLMLIGAGIWCEILLPRAGGVPVAAASLYALYLSPLLLHRRPRVKKAPVAAPHPELVPAEVES